MKRQPKRSSAPRTDHSDRDQPRLDEVTGGGGLVVCPVVDGKVKCP